MTVADVYPRDKVEVKFDGVERIGVIVIELGEVSRGSFISSAIWYPNSTFDESLRDVPLSPLLEEVRFKYEG